MPSSQYVLALAGAVVTQSLVTLHVPARRMLLVTLARLRARAL